MRRIAPAAVVCALLLSAMPSPVAAAEDNLGRAPPSRGAEVVYQEQHALFDRSFALETGLTYTRSDRRQLTLSGFLALDAIFLGNISVDEVKADILTLDLTGRKTLSDRLQVDVNLPFLYRSTRFQSGGAGGSASALVEADVASDVELGDLSVGAYFQLLRESATRPDVVWNLRVKAPTGTHPYGVELETIDPDGANMRVPRELPSGNGVVAASTGLSFVKTVDPAILFASLSYFYNFSRHFDDIDSTTGEQPGEIKLGDSLQYGLGTAFALNQRMSLSLSYTQRFAAKSKTRPDSTGSWERIIGSDANAASLSYGLVYAYAERKSLVVSVAEGLTPDAPDLSLALKLVTLF